jgi:hypothetical protein
VRKKWPTVVEATILLASKRRCAFCFGLRGDTRAKRGQIAHIDRDASNSTVGNGAWLCTPHHDQYDSVSRQTKRYTPGELRKYKAMVIKHMKQPLVWPDTSTKLPRQRGAGVSLEVYDRRIPIYRATLDFIRLNTRGAELEIQALFKFAADTDEALFLFDEKVANYLNELYRKANHLQAADQMVRPVESRTPALVQERMQLLLWFSEQFEPTRRLFAPYLRIEDGR